MCQDHISIDHIPGLWASAAAAPATPSRGRDMMDSEARQHPGHARRSGPAFLSGNVGLERLWVGNPGWCVAQEGARLRIYGDEHAHADLQCRAFDADGGKVHFGPRTTVCSRPETWKWLSGCWYYRGQATAYTARRGELGRGGGCLLYPALRERCSRGSK